MAGHRMESGREAVPVPPLEFDPMQEELPPADVSVPPLIELKGVSAGNLLSAIDCTFPAGQVVGVTGIIGSGPHDLAQLLFGLLPLSKGQCLLNGKAYAPSHPSQAIAQGVFMIPEDPGRDGLVGLMSVAKNITLIDLPAITRLGVLQISTEAKLARTYVTELHINPPNIQREVRTLSGGNQQKVLLAKSLQAKAHALILEEPTQGVDVNAKEEIHRIIRELAASGKAVLVISTDIRDLLQFTDRILVFRKGHIVADTPTRTTDYTQVLNLTLGTEKTSWSQEKA